MSSSKGIVMCCDMCRNGYILNMITACSKRQGTNNILTASGKDKPESKLVFRVVRLISETLDRPVHGCLCNCPATPYYSFRFNGELCVENPGSLGFYDCFSGVQSRRGTVTSSEKTLTREQPLLFIHHVTGQVACLCHLCSTKSHVMIPTAARVVGPVPLVARAVALIFCWMMF